MSIGRGIRRFLSQMGTSESCREEEPMKTIPLTAFALGIVASIMLSQPSFAFHDSALDPAIKQHLARAIEMLESRCASGGKARAS